MHHFFLTTIVRVIALRKQREVLGICLVGSKSRGFDHARSDDDLDVLITDDTFSHTAPDALVEQHFDTQGTMPKLCTDLRYLSQQMVQDKRASPLDADHWPYTGASYGCIQERIMILGQMDPGFRRQHVTYAVLSTTIAIRKTCKAMRRGYAISAHLSLARGANCQADKLGS